MRNISYGRQFIDKNDMRAVATILKSDWLTQGPKIREFEDALCGYTGAKYAVAVSSGTAALHIACLAAGVKKGDEVITSPITFAASANCVLYCGGKPVFADIEADTANIDPDEIRKHINKRTKAIIPVHYAGHPADLEEIRNIAKKHNLIIIEDAAHALGATYKNSKIGSCKYSDMTIFSFHPVKAITTGEGGAVLTNRKDLYEKLLMLRNHGITKDLLQLTAYSLQLTGPWYYEQQCLGFNYRITDIQCALGVSQLKKLDSFIDKRRRIARHYNKSFANNPYFDIPCERGYATSSYHLYPIRLKGSCSAKRKELFAALRRNGIGAQVHYIPVYLHPYYEQLGYKKDLCPNAEDFYRREISIPLHPCMSGQDIDYVIDTLLKIAKKANKIS